MMETEVYSSENSSSFDSTSTFQHQDDSLIVKQKSLHHHHKPPPAAATTPSSFSTSSLLFGFASKLQAHEWLLGIGAIIAMYLVNGPFASTVCALATSVPAVIHSYRVITEEKENLSAHQVTLCYWILLGSMSIFDFFLGNAFCYYFGKFILMSSVYAHVVAKSRTPKPAPPAPIQQYQMVVKESSKVFQQQPQRHLFSGHESTAATQEPTVLSTPLLQSPVLTEGSSVTGSITGPPVTSKHSSLANYLQWTKAKENATSYNSPTVSSLTAPTTPSTTTSTTTSTTSTFVAENQRSPTPTEFSVHESDQPKPNNIVSLPCGDAQSYSATFSSGTSNFGEMPIQSNTAVSNFNEASLSSTIDGNTFLRHRVVSPSQLRSHIHTSPASTDWSRTLTPLRSPQAYSHRVAPISNRRTPNDSSMLSSIKSIETLPCFENDLSSDPHHTINFKSPFNNNVNLTITNVTTNRIMWALKTNAMDRIIATPTCGFLPAGNTVHIKMAVREKSEIHSADSSRDRMAIDYVFVPDTCVTYNPSRIIAKNADARRKSFDINYVL